MSRKEVVNFSRVKAKAQFKKIHRKSASKIHNRNTFSLYSMLFHKNNNKQAMVFDVQ